MRTFLIAILTLLPAAAEIRAEAPAYLYLIRSPRGDAGLIMDYIQTGLPVNVFGMRTITGPSETWLMEWHDSFQSIEEVDKAMQPRRANLAERMEQTAQIGLYRPNWSYRPDLAVKAFAKAKYFQVTVHHFRPGGDSDFAGLMKARRNGLDRINLDRPDIVYQVVSGSTTETFIVLMPLASLKTLDDAMARIPAAGESGPRPRDKIAADIELTRENLLLRVEPGISFVDQNISQADPVFWRSPNRR